MKVKGKKQCLNYGTISDLEPILQVWKTWCIIGKQINFKNHILKSSSWSITNCILKLHIRLEVCQLHLPFLNPEFKTACLFSDQSWTPPLKMEKLQNIWIIFKMVWEWCTVSISFYLLLKQECRLAWREECSSSQTIKEINLLVILLMKLTSGLITPGPNWEDILMIKTWSPTLVLCLTK